MKISRKKGIYNLITLDKTFVMKDFFSPLFNFNLHLTKIQIFFNHYFANCFKINDI